MVDVSTRFFRHLMRSITKECIIWTEMTHANTILHSPYADELMSPDAEGPLIYQLGGNCPELMSKAAMRVEGYGYDEININCGCPSDKADKGEFGACLML